jgi:hypothetical protein
MMFRCQFSGEASDGPVYRTVVKTEKTNDGKESKARERELVKPAEKPVRVVIETRHRTYENWGWDEEGRRVRLDDTQGSEIVRELTVRSRHVEAVKRKYGID